MKRKSPVPTEIPAAKLLEDLVQQAAQTGASDIHLQMNGTAAAVFFRLDGLLAPVVQWPGEIAERVFGRIKFLARLKTYQESLPQDGRIEKDDIHTQTDIRVATYPTVTGEKIVLRLFTLNSGRRLEELGFPEAALAQLQTVLRRTTGLMLLTGPAGSGKTTTIYACLRHLSDSPGRHIITVEDPVEQIIPGIMQTEVNEARGLTFALAGRHLLRQDPQVLVLGEIRDDETANLAIRAALTGHLVISTLHAGSCKGVFERLEVLCPDPHAVVSAAALVLNQRLIRRLCPGCRGMGCAECLRTGYRSRMPIVEWVAIDDAARTDLRARGAESVKPTQTLAAAAARLVESGETNAAEAARILE